MRNVPKINRDYWQALIAASVFGTNTGDFVADYLHLGHLAGFPFLLLLFAAILLAQRSLRAGSALFFWAAIITVRTAATNVGDAFKDFHLGFPISVPLMAIVFVASVALYARRQARRPGEGAIRVDAAYWGCMMLAGVLGTLGGDCSSYLLGHNHAATAGIFGALALGAIAWTAKRPSAARYWTAVALVRIAGTGGGDALAHLLGLSASTAITGCIFVALVAWSCTLQSAATQAQSRAAA
jgi:uncharacterized membrane-anchored protein